MRNSNGGVMSKKANFFGSKTTLERAKQGFVWNHKRTDQVRFDITTTYCRLLLLLLLLLLLPGSRRSYNHATAVLRGLIFMLVDQHPTLISHVWREYDKAEAKVFENTNAWEALLGFLTDILRDPLLQTTYSIIDALDVCTTGLSRLHHFIVGKSSSYPNVKWFVSSRNWPTIEQALETVSRKERLWIELNEASVSKTIASFVHCMVQILKSKKQFSDDIQDTVSQLFLANAQGTFLRVALVCEELAKLDVSIRVIRKKLKEFPAGFDQLYQRMLSQIGDTDDAELCKSILSISRMVYHPITLEELSVYIDLSEDELSDLE